MVLRFSYVNYTPPKEGGFEGIIKLRFLSLTQSGQFLPFLITVHPWTVSQSLILALTKSNYLTDAQLWERQLC